MELKHSFGTVVACGLVEQLERCGLKVRGLVGPDGQVVPALYCFSDSLPGRLWQSQSTQPFWLPCACSAAPDLSASHLCQCAETAHWAAKVHCSSQQLPDTDWDLPCSATWDMVEISKTAGVLTWVSPIIPESQASVSEQIHSATLSQTPSRPRFTV